MLVGTLKFWNISSDYVLPVIFLSDTIPQLRWYGYDKDDVIKVWPIMAADTQCLCAWLFFMWRLTCTQISNRATQRYSAHCANAFELRGLGVHIKLIKSVMEIMVCCRPGTSIQSLGCLLISDGREEVDRWEWKSSSNSLSSQAG